jgi:hypothetical protein
MSLAYTILRENQLVLTKFEGTITKHEVLEHIRRLREDPAFVATFSELADLTNAVEVQLSYNDFQELSHFDPFSQQSKRAFVARTGSQAYGMTRVYEVASGNPNIRIFNTIDEGFHWLQDDSDRAAG